MIETQKKMKSIWFFVGLILLAMGGLVFLSSLYSLIFHVRHQTVLAHLHPGIWWGAIMVVAGFVFFIKNK